MKKEPDSELTIEECRKILEKYNLSDEEIEMIRDSLVGLVNQILSYYLDQHR